MRKMKSKLFFQISIIILPIFALITAAVLIVVYFSSIKAQRVTSQQNLPHQCIRRPTRAICTDFQSYLAGE